MKGANLLKVAYAILDKKGRVIFDDVEGCLIYKTKSAASNEIIPGEGETVQKVSIIAA